MVQGKSKTSGKASSSAAARHVHKNLKKGRRAIAPKKALAIQTNGIKKNLSAKIHNSVERQIVAAASGGKLTIMKPAPETKKKQ